MSKIAAHNIMGAKRTKIDWLVPYPIQGSGGHRTIFDHVRELSERGYECVMHVQDRDELISPSVAKSALELDQIIKKLFFDTGARIVSGWESLESCDVLFATMWQSAAPVAAATCAKHRAYFVQDFEAYFNPMGDGFLMAEQSYKLGLQSVTIGRWLTNLLTTKYKGNANFFDFSIDPSIYNPKQLRKSIAPSIAFIFQPDKPRRCAWLGTQALGIVKHHMPEVEIYLYGSEQSTSNLWYEHSNCGLLSPRQTAELYKKSWVGLCISSSNPSRIPFEMMACGCAVVDINRENNYFDYEPGAISLAEPTPQALADKIMHLLVSNSARQTQVNAGLEMASKRDSKQCFDQFVAIVENICSKGSVSFSDRSAPCPETQNAAFASEVKVLREELRIANVLLNSGSYCVKNSFRIIKRRLGESLRPW